jgi:diguanylate cyclase (GGDEF)-like protein
MNLGTNGNGNGSGADDTVEYNAVDLAATLEAQAFHAEAIAADDPSMQAFVLGVDTHPSIDVDAEVAEDLPIVGAALTVLSGPDAGRFFLVGPDGHLLGRGEGADTSFADLTVSRLHARLELQDNVFVLEDLKSNNGTHVDTDRVRGCYPLPDLCRIRLGRSTVVQFLAVDQQQVEATKRIADSLVVDRVTGTGNRSHLDQRLVEELSFSLRHGTPLGLVLIDLDNFKAVNDLHGHQAGDRLLRRIGKVLKDTVRLEDAVFRYGGDEFCVLVRGIASEGMMRLAERVRDAVEREGDLPDLADASVTASVGVANAIQREGESTETLVHRADEALYEAKQKGRNRAVFRFA